MPEQPHAFSKLAEELIGDFRGVSGAEPARQVKRATRPLAELIEELMIKHQVGRPSPEQAVRDQWTIVVGAALAQHSHAARIERNRLVVLASNAVVRSELTHYREKILERVRALPGCGEVKYLTVRAG